MMIKYMVVEICFGDRDVPVVEVMAYALPSFLAAYQCREEFLANEGLEEDPDVQVMMYEDHAEAEGNEHYEG